MKDNLGKTVEILKEDVDNLDKTVDKTIIGLRRLKSQNKKLREALQTIANGEYCEGEEGEIAQKALKESESDNAK